MPIETNRAAAPGLFSTHIVGPIHSRRLGVSLGVNLLPTEGKVCSFDCLYCECGWNADHRGGQLAQPDPLMKALAQRLDEMHQQHAPLDVITFAGNGEPTLHPAFSQVIDTTITLRNQYYPEAKVSVLSNATQIDKPDVFEALLRVDNNILKLDSAFDTTARLIDQPQNPHYSIRHVVDGMKRFAGRCIVQTMFVRGAHNGVAFDNTTPEEVAAWIDLIREIRPSQVMAYSLDRPTPEKNLQRVTHEEMAALVAPLLQEGFHVSIA